jgi:hypothetical protein
MFCQIHADHRIFRHGCRPFRSVAFNTTSLAHCDAVWGGRQPPHLHQRDDLSEFWPMRLFGAWMLTSDGPLASFLAVFLFIGRSYPMATRSSVSGLLSKFAISRSTAGSNRPSDAAALQSTDRCPFPSDGRDAVPISLGAQPESPRRPASAAMHPTTALERGIRYPLFVSCADFVAVVQLYRASSIEVFSDVSCSRACPFHSFSPVAAIRSMKLRA